MKKNKELVASKIRYEKLKTTTKDIGKTKVKVEKSSIGLKKASKVREKIMAKVVKTAKELKTTAKDIGKTKVKVAETAKELETMAKKDELVRAEFLKKAAKLKTVAKEKEKIRIKVSKGAVELKKLAKGKEEARVELVKKAAKLKTVAKEKEKIRIKVSKGAVELKKLAKGKEEVRFKLVEIAKQLAKTAEEKEEVRIRFAKTAAIIKDLSDRNEAILSSIGDAAFACDKEGKIILFNKMAEEITGIAKKDALGEPYGQVTSFINEKTGEPAVDFISEAIKKRIKTGMDEDTVLVRKDGKKIPVADTAAPIFDSKGVVTGCIVVFRDVTKERSIDQAKTELVSLASHQLRSPLTAIGWYAELLESETNGILTPKQLKLTREIRDAYKRMTTLVNSLLNVSRISMGTFAVDPGSTNIENVAKTTLELFKHEIEEKKLTIRENYDKRLDNFWADPKILSVIFQNLISNAVKYTPSGGKIVINIKKQKFLEISISDTGMGIPKYQQAKIFTKLFRADNANDVDPSGTGLGLYIVYEIVKASGGTVRFDSEVKRGSTFYVSYPLKGMVRKIGEKSLS